MEHVSATAEKDEPLRYDVRLLGRILGDTVRAFEGEAAFDLIERIRQTALRFHRDADEPARLELEAIISDLTHDLATCIIRAFSYFSHLANIAEDQHHIRRTRAHAMVNDAPRAGTMAHALRQARSAGLSRDALRDFFASALCTAVLTAHPTEIRRQSSIERELEIARLLDARDRVQFTPEELEENRAALRRAVLTLWQTSMLRGTRLRVIDEVANGLSYYDYTFLRGLPRFYADLEDELSRDADWQGVDVTSFLNIGSWIGGDRDGNPFVTAEVLSQALSMHSARALRFYLDELHQLGAELSLDGRMVPVSEALRELAERSADRSPQRQDKPYRRVISGMYARLAASAWALSETEAPRHAVAAATPYASAEEFVRELDIIAQSLQANGSADLARGRVRHLRRAADVFGFHLAPIDLRQNSDVHEAVLAELFDAAGVCADYRALDEAARIELLLAEIRTPRPLTSPHLSYSDRTTGELAILRAAADGHRLYGAASIPHYVISKADAVSDVLEVAVLLKDVGLLRPREPMLDLDIVPLFETIRDLERAAEILGLMLDDPSYRRHLSRHSGCSLLLRLRFRSETQPRRQSVAVLDAAAVHLSELDCS